MNVSELANETLLPTHTCFDDAIRFLLSFSEREFRNGATVVHAILEIDGRRYAHAWAEYEEPDLGCRAVVQSCLWRGIRHFHAVERDAFISSHAILHSRRYSFTDVFIFAAMSNNIGPWDPKILEPSLMLAEDEPPVPLKRVQYGRTLLQREPDWTFGHDTSELVDCDPEAKMILGAVQLDPVRRAEIFERLRHVQRISPPRRSFDDT